jgi:uncharacterized membrane protein
VNKKGIVNKIAVVVPFAIIMVVLGLLLTFTADIQQDVADDQTADSYAANISLLAQEANNDIAERQDTLVSIGIAVVLIGLIMGFFALGRR